jgi:hypothetical protein
LVKTGYCPTQQENYSYTEKRPGPQDDKRIWKLYADTNFCVNPVIKPLEGTANGTSLTAAIPTFTDVMELLLSLVCFYVIMVCDLQN